MAEIENEKLMKSLKKYLKNLKKHFKIDKAILFGSRARGDYFLDSDVDIILVSEDFKFKRLIERMVDVLGFWEEHIDLEPLCYTPEEFEKKKKQIGIVRQAVKEGINFN